MDIVAFKKFPVLGILRGVSQNVIEPLVEVISGSGLKTIEITMNTPQASGLIKLARKTASGRLTIGAGTVLDKESLKSALDAGATFVVMPVVVKEVVSYCVKNKIPVFPGALTPKEIYDAWNMGATMVKVFPAKFFGPQYFSEIKGPFNNIELLACAGVTPDNLKTYFACGADAVAFGSSVFKKDWLEGNDLANIEKAIRNYVGSFKALGNITGQ